jgi:putative nucleotidyltransferase with HDIG domain
MKLYRVKQFIWAAFSKINGEDIIYIKSYLNEEEQKLFFLLSISEQKHSIRVAHEVQRLIEIGKDTQKLDIKEKDFIRAALFHDIGKIDKHLNILDKSILVILNKIAGNTMRKLTNIKKVDVYYNHAEKGYEILNKLRNYDDRFLYLVRNHHNNDIINDIELNILKCADSLN